MSKGKKIFLAVAGVVAVIAVIVLINKLTDNKDGFSEKYQGTNLETAEGAFERENTYTAYLAAHKDSPRPQVDEIMVDLAAYDTASAKNTDILTDYEGEEKVLYQGESGFTEWKVNIPETGMYRIYVEYYPVESRGVSMERGFYINGEMPFSGSDALTFTRRWADAGEIKVDNRGNDRRPTQVEVPDWCSSYFIDYMGYYTDPYEYYFKAGENTIALDCVNEPMAIRKISLQPVTDAVTYQEYVKANPQVTGGADYKQDIQGEASTARSAQSLYARSDRSSPNTVPYSVKSTKLNFIGGEQWRTAGQWIEWEFEVPENGYYNITFKARQSTKRGAVSNRAIYIDGKIPFAEMSTVPFQYSSQWQSVPLADSEGTPYNFYLEAGKHTIRMEVTLGDMGLILSELQDSVSRLNEMYRTVLVLTGATPDVNRDYDLDKVYPEVIEGMELEYKRLYKIVDEYIAYSGETSGDIATVLKLAKQLEEFVEKTEKISKQFASFKGNVSSVGTSINNMAEAPLDVDYITVTGVNAKPDDIKTSFWQEMVHEVRSFASSFVVDYDSLGDVYEDGEAITVWITSGRDQSSVLKTLVDDVFTPETGIPVNIKLVQAGVVLNATIAGTGPDIAIQMGQQDPVNFALRNAVEDLTQFEGWEELLSQYPDSAKAPYWFEGGLYGLPMTHVFNVMFYRTDILDDLGVEPPQTWDELIDMLPTLQQNNLDVAIPSTERKFGNTSSPDLSTFIALLYQNGGRLYSEKQTETLISSEAGIKAFEMYTRFYSHYSLSMVYDFANRFRSGEMPLGIQDYDTYNTLAVLAPEIRGLWEFNLIPGTMQEDGTIDRSCSSWGYCTMLLKNKKRSDEMQQKCWEFLKWWGDSETQTRFGRELEAVMGSAARYQTANLISFEQLPWSADQMAILKEQRSWTEEVPEVAGGYYTTRHITNAARKVYNESEDPRETLLDYTDTINEEITKKRGEFGLEIE
ncbi:MAG: extracellular solute-binding protein [Lachnospiraceae bacterium]|nr:extracellular solute-binding protein [Lachnospiraceae bacterium]